MKAVMTGLIALLIILMIVPIPPASDTVDPRTLPDLTGDFIQVGGIDLYVEEKGDRAPALILLHGFAAGTFSWEPVVAELAEVGTVLAYDRPGFGMTPRPDPASLPVNWYRNDRAPELLIKLMDQKNITSAVLVGHSAGGTVALHTALLYPERVQALVLEAPAIYTSGGLPSWLRPFLTFPPMDRLGPLFMRLVPRRADQLLEAAWYNPERIPEGTLDAYRRPLRVEDWDRGLWEVVKGNQALSLADELDNITIPTLIITGDSDTIVSKDDSVRLGHALPSAEVTVFSQCGHLPHEEYPQRFTETVHDFLVRKSVIQPTSGAGH